MSQYYLPSRARRLLPRLLDMATKSPINQQHAAVLIKNGLPLAWGYNNISGNKILHAECAAVNKYCRSKKVNIGYCAKCSKKECNKQN